MQGSFPEIEREGQRSRLCVRYMDEIRGSLFVEVHLWRIAVAIAMSTQGSLSFYSDFLLLQVHSSAKKPDVFVRMFRL